MVGGGNIGFWVWCLVSGPVYRGASDILPHSLTQLSSHLTRLTHPHIKQESVSLSQAAVSPMRALDISLG